MPLLTRKRQIAIEQEAAEGTAETLVAADVQFDVEDIESSFTPEPQERNALSATLSPEGVLMGARSGSISGRTELKQRNSGDAVTTTPPFHDLLLSCGLGQGTVETIVLTGAPTGTFTPGENITGDSGGDVYFVGLSGTTLTYAVGVSGSDLSTGEALTGADSGATATVSISASTQAGVCYHPISASVPSFTIGDYMDGTELTVYGARANAQIGASEVGAIGYLNFQAQGTAMAPGDAALFTGITIPDIQPETFIGASVAIGGDSLCVNSFSLDMGNELALRRCASAATGIFSALITRRQPVISIDPERELEATIPFFTNFAAGTRFGFDAVIGSTAGLRTKIVAGRCQYQELPQADRDGIAVLNAQLRLSKATPDGDDEFFVCFY